MRVGDLDSGERLLTAEQVAAAAGITRRTLLNYLTMIPERAPAPDVRVGHLPLWLESTVDAWLARRAA